jgi:copper oxidase (laccase) domain-containing protein
MNRVVTDSAVRLVSDPASPLYRVTVFDKVPNVLHAMTRRNFPGAASPAGLKPGSFAGAAGRALRAEFARRLGIELAHTLWLDPEDSGEIVFCSETDRGQGADDWESRVRGAGGIVTDAFNLFLCTLYNDNVVVLLFDPRWYGIGLINIATGQTSSDAIGNAVELLSQRTGAEPREICGLIGPSMGPCCRTFPNPDLAGARGLSNLWDLARGELLKAGVNRNHIFNPRVCTACSDTEFFSREVDGAAGGTGAMAFGILDDGSFRAQLDMRRAAQKMRRPWSPAPQETSLTGEEKRLNRLIRCPHGQNKVYVRSVFDGQSAETSKPQIALRCAVMEHVGQAMGGYNIVMKDYIEKVCCADYLHCRAYQEFLRRKAKR